MLGERGCRGNGLRLLSTAIMIVEETMSSSSADCDNASSSVLYSSAASLRDSVAKFQAAISQLQPAAAVVQY